MELAAPLRRLQCWSWSPVAGVGCEEGMPCRSRKRLRPICRICGALPGRSPAARRAGTPMSSRRSRRCWPTPPSSPDDLPPRVALYRTFLQDPQLHRVEQRETATTAPHGPRGGAPQPRHADPARTAGLPAHRRRGVLARRMRPLVMDVDASRAAAPRRRGRPRDRPADRHRRGDHRGRAADRARSGAPRHRARPSRRQDRPHRAAGRSRPSSARGRASSSPTSSWPTAAPASMPSTRSCARSRCR